MDISETKALLNEEDSADMVAMAKEELVGWKRRKNNIERDLQLMLIPKDPLDEKNVIVEIRAGTGGEESALFAAELFRMYSKYAEKHGGRLGSLIAIQQA